MADLTATDEDHVAIRDILLQWKAEGNENPLLPMDVDVDGDGIVDSFGLDKDDNVIVVSGTKLEDTVYVAEDEEPAEEVPDA
jgi:hypothetical protein